MFCKEFLLLPKSLSTYSKIKYYKLYSSWSAQQSQGSINGIYYLLCSPYVQKRFLGNSNSNKSNKDSDDENLDDDKSHHFNNSSNFYQRYHRQSYESKRDDSDRNDHRYTDTRSNRTNKRPTRVEADHYQRLNVEPDADLETIKSAYYSLSKLYHPDIVGSDDSEAAENFRLITESYDILSDPQLRADYDRQLDPGIGLDTATAQDDAGRYQRTAYRNPNIIYRTMDADMFFRARQEAAMDREKLLNPRKFKAGAFVGSSSGGDQVINSREALERYRRRLSNLRSARARGSTTDGSDFYREHLYNTIHRKHADLSFQEDYTDAIAYRRSLSSSQTSDPTSIMFVLGGMPVLLVVFILFFYLDIDWASDLDNRLDKAINENYINNRSDNSKK